MKDCHVIDEEAPEYPKIASFETVAECEGYIIGLFNSSPEERAKVERGGFGIDAPEHKTNPPRRSP